MKARLLLIVLLVSTVLAACGKDDVPPASSGDPTTTTTTTTETEEETTSTTEAEDEVAAATEVDITAADFSFAFDDAPIPAGVVTLNVTNEGAEEHQAAIVRFEEGKSLDDLAAMGDDASQLNAIVVTEGGPNGVAPGARVSSTPARSP